METFFGVPFAQLCRPLDNPYSLSALFGTCAWKVIVALEYHINNLKPDPSWQVKTEVAARQCELKDFMKFPDNADVAKEHFEAWNGYSILCPDSDDFNLLGNSASMVQKYFSLEISKCNPA